MIAAMAHNRVIGKDNDMPWHLPADLQHFKKVTLGKPVLMGRKTFESIGRPLPGRRNIVISRNSDYNKEGIEVVGSVEAALELVKDSDEVMVIGGGHIYELFLPFAERLYLTFIDLQGQWQEVATESNEPDAKNNHSYKFVTLDKKL